MGSIRTKESWIDKHKEALCVEGSEFYDRRLIRRLHIQVRTAPTSFLAANRFLKQMPI